jgi:catechol 2,3-dioxygenase
MDTAEGRRPDADATNETSTLIAHIEQVDLRVRDVDASLGFYRDVVGLDVAERNPTEASLGPRGGEAFLRLSSQGIVGSADPRATGLFHIAIRYPKRSSLGDALARLVDGGYDVGAGDHGVSEALYIDDPDGNGVELYRDRPIEQWPTPGPGERVRMGTAPVDLRALLDDSKDAGSDAPPGTVMGHVHFQVSDLDASRTFYAEGLGLDLMAAIDDQAAFFSSNGYHHHVGANIWRSRGRGPAVRDRAGLESVTFRVDDPRELGNAQARLGDSVAQGDAVVVHDPDDIELRFSTRT